MTYTPAQRAKLAKVFRGAKDFLSDTMFETVVGNKSPYICHAIDRASNRSVRAAAMAKEIVLTRIDNRAFFSSWVRANSTLTLSEKALWDHYHNQGRDMQRHRQAWLDMLVKEFETPQ